MPIPISGQPQREYADGLPFKLEEYIELVDLTGRQMREGKKGKIDATELPILQRLNIVNDNWKALTQHFEKNTEGLVGTVFKLKAACEKLGYQRTVCKQSCEQFFFIKISSEIKIFFNQPLIDVFCCLKIRNTC